MQFGHVRQRQSVLRKEQPHTKLHMHTRAFGFITAITTQWHTQIIIFMS